jgi:putative endonuclease
MSDWFVYMLRCADNSLYTGVTTDVERRLVEHNAAKSVTKYTRVRQPVRVAYQEKAESRSEACKREAQLKKLKKHEKEILVEGEEANG